MHRKALSMLVSLALTLALMAPVTPVLAADDEAAAAPVTAPDEGLVEESDTGSYVVVMAADPLVTTEGTDNLDSATAKRREDALLAEQDEALSAIGLEPDKKINTYTVALNGFSTRMSHEKAEALALRKDVAYVVPDVMRQATTDASPSFLGLTGRNGVWKKTGLTGEGVVVGVIDNGIWPEHPSFADNGSYPAPPTGDLPCEFGNTAHNPNDAPFECNNKLIGARQMLDTYRSLIGAEPDEFDSARDDDGHGTHTASTAAGNRGVRSKVLGRYTGRISGIAPRAHIIAYKGLGEQGGFSSDLAAAIDQAVADGVDVINYSIGGGPSLIGADDIAFLFAADAGVFAATSAGNDGEGPGTIGGPATVPWITTVGASTQPRFFQGKVKLGNGRQFKGATIAPRSTRRARLVDAADAGDELCTPGSLDPKKVKGSIVLCLRGAVARVAKSKEVADAGGIGMIMYETDDVGNLFTDTHWVPSVHVDNSVGRKIKRYIATTKRPRARLTAWRKRSWKWAPSMADFSSRGPNPIVEDIIKPDVTAPGHQILAGASPLPSPDLTVPGQLFQSISGTSMSSPHVAGLFALVKQAHPDWTPAQARSAIMTTARTDVLNNDRRRRATPFAMGAGHIDPGAAKGKGTPFDPGLVYDAGFDQYLGFLCDAGPEVFANPDATCQALADAGVPTEAANLNLASIGVAQLAGERTVTRTVTSVADAPVKFQASVKAPPGYKVKVSPKRFTLLPGEKATYKVTIRNKSAKPDKWRFGAVTWRSIGARSGVGYTVRSPIAVKATRFAAPAEVTGEGVDGAVRFDIQFGYSGPYTAAAHGLEPATVTEGTVAQDPDQTFDPTDGFAETHEFELSGAAHFRIAMPPDAVPPDVDIDLYVTNPAGEIVASSTNGATDELIDIPLPEDGTWTVWVHGWQTVTPTVDYSLYTWQVSATPGGNLTIDQAPTQATLGQIATIEASWTGAAAGQWHLGAVSHSDGDGLLGLTLVEVDNR